MMRVLDLGYRTGSATAAWANAGHTVIGVDWNYFGQVIQGDYFKIDTWQRIRKLGPYDFIWFSPDCSIFSLMNMRWNNHWNGSIPLTDAAKHQKKGIEYVLRQIRRENPRLGWVMENPRAMMRKMDFVKDLHRVTVTYCQYRDGEGPMKPTDLFGKLPLTFFPKSCQNGSRCHTPAPRGSKTGTQGLGKTEAGKIPLRLSEEIMDCAIESNGSSYPTLWGAY